MRFFTLVWWCRIQGGDFSNDPFASYWSYLATIRERLPHELLALHESASLHDGVLRELELAPSNATLTLQIDGDDSGRFRRFTLIYRGVSSYRTMSDPAVGLLGPHGYGHWGYDEVDVTENGEFEHRILFSSGIEIIVRFADFELAETGATLTALELTKETGFISR